MTDPNNLGEKAFPDLNCRAIGRPYSYPNSMEIPRFQSSSPWLSDGSDRTDRAVKSSSPSDGSDDIDVSAAANILLNLFAEDGRASASRLSSCSPSSFDDEHINDITMECDDTSDDRHGGQSIHDSSYTASPTHYSQLVNSNTSLHGYASSDRHGFDPSFKDILLDTPARQPPPRPQPNQKRVPKKTAKAMAMTSAVNAAAPSRSRASKPKAKKSKTAVAQSRPPKRPACEEPDQPVRPAKRAKTATKAKAGTKSRKNNAKIPAVPSSDLNDRAGAEMPTAPSADLNDRAGAEMPAAPSADLNDRAGAKMPAAPSADLNERAGTKISTLPTPPRDAVSPHLPKQQRLKLTLPKPPPTRPCLLPPSPVTPPILKTLSPYVPSFPNQSKDPMSRAKSSGGHNKKKRSPAQKAPTSSPAQKAPTSSPAVEADGVATQLSETSNKEVNAADMDSVPVIAPRNILGNVGDERNIIEDGKKRVRKQVYRGP